MLFDNKMGVFERVLREAAANRAGVVISYDPQSRQYMIYGVDLSTVVAGGTTNSFRGYNVNAAINNLTGYVPVASNMYVALTRRYENSSADAKRRENLAIQNFQKPALKPGEPLPDFSPNTTPKDDHQQHRPASPVVGFIDSVKQRLKEVTTPIIIPKKAKEHQIEQVATEIFRDTPTIKVASVKEETHVSPKPTVDQSVDQDQS